MRPPRLVERSIERGPDLCEVLRRTGRRNLVVQSETAFQKRAETLAAAADALKQAGGAKARAAPFSLAFLTDRNRCPEGESIARALPKGTAIIFRDYDAPDRETLARTYRTICSEHGLLLLVGGDAALAKEIGADGAHLRSADLAAGQSPQAEMIVSAAAHSMAELTLAARAGADIAFLSPAYATRSHLGAPPLGPQRFKSLASAAQLPVLALGGVDETNASSLAVENVTGLGAIGAFSPTD